MILCKKLRPSIHLLKHVTRLDTDTLDLDMISALDLPAFCDRIRHGFNAGTTS